MAKSLMPCMNGEVTRWANGKYGKMEFLSEIDFFSAISCRFIEYDEKTREPLYSVEERDEKCPVVAKGFSAFILMSLKNQKYQKDVDFYEDYFQSLRYRHLDLIKTIPGASGQDTDEEIYKNHVYIEDINLKASAPVFDYLPKSDQSMLKAYNRYYLEHIQQYSKFSSKQYTSFDQALAECDIEDKILLHAINNFCKPPNIKPYVLYNHILLLRVMYREKPGKCIEHIQTIYKKEWKEYVVVLHTIKTTFDPAADIQLLLPEKYADEQTLQAYELQKNEYRKRLTGKQDATPVQELKEENLEETGNTGNPNFPYDTQKVRKIYSEYNDHLFESVKELDFYNIIAAATLNELTVKEGMKAKFRYMIYTLSQVIRDKDWYKTASRSVNTEPLRCSGANVDYIWKKRATSLIK